MNPYVAQESRAFPPLTDPELAALYQACRTREMRRALWEIARLQSQSVELFRLVETCVTHPAQGQHAAYYALTPIATREPCIVEMLADDWRRRAIPYTRYFSHDRPVGAPQPRYEAPRPIPLAPPPPPHVMHKPPEEPEPPYARS